MRSPTESVAKLPGAPMAWRVVTMVGIGRPQLDFGDDAATAFAFTAVLTNDTTPVNKVSPNRIEARAGLALASHRKGDDATARNRLDQA